MARGKKRASYAIRQRARSLRKSSTAAEALLWEHIRGRQINGLKFRRQHPIGRFIVDFCCPKARLVIEIDGAVHNTQVEYDQARTEVLEAEGYQIIRFSNEQIITNIHSVLQSLKTLT